MGRAGRVDLQALPQEMMQRQAGDLRGRIPQRHVERADGDATFAMPAGFLALHHRCPGAQGLDVARLQEARCKAFADQAAAYCLARRRLLGHANGICQAVPDRFECNEIAAILGIELLQGQGGFAADDLASRGVDGVLPDAVVVKGLYPVDR